MLVALGLVWGMTMVTTGPASAQATPAIEGSEKSIELGNTSAADGPEAVATVPGAADASASAKAEPAEAEPAKDPRELHRDLVLQMPDVMPAGTSAASRRYKKVDLSAYRALMQNSAAQPAQ
jgi:hypothetical protein